jgi:hypothetical protein
MNNKARNAIATLALIAMAPMATQAADGTFDRKLSVKGPVLLSVETGSGNIHVQPGSASEVHIVAHVHAGSGWSLSGGSSADDRVKEVIAHPPITQAGNIISVGKQKVQNVAIDYEITTPRGTDLRADTGSGDIHIADEGGPVHARTGSGTIDATGLSDHVNLETGSGNIKASMLSSLDVKAQTGSGSIQLKNVQGSLWADTGSGSLEIAGKPSASWKIETGSGDVNLSVGSAPYSLDAETGSGDVQTSAPITSQSSDKHHIVGNVGGGGPKVRIVTGSGDIRIH